MFFAGAVPALVYGLLALAIPESPRHLVGRGQLVKAAAVLRLMEGVAEVGTKIDEIALTLKRETAPSLRDLRGPRSGLLGGVWVGIGLSVLQQFVGVNVIFYYSSTQWRSVGFSEADALTTSVITSVTNVVVTLIAISLVDRVGRKPLLLTGSVGMALSLGVMALCFGQGLGGGAQPVLQAPANTIALVAANAYVVFFGVSWGPVVWVLPGGMFSNRIRAVALSVAAALQWIANFLVSISFPVFTQRLSLAFAYGLYGAFAALSFFFVFRFVKATRGKELEAMVD